jgi:autotransporter translocation and assembly factor TamB
VGLARGLALAVLGVLLLLAAASALLQTDWAHSRLRGLIVNQANRYFTATLEIAGLRGSLFSGIELDGVRLSRDGDVLVAIDHVRVSYSIRELASQGTLIRRLSLDRPRILAARDADGRWNLGALVKRDTQPNRPAAAGREIRIAQLEIADGTVTFRDALDLGAVHAPTLFTQLNATLSFSYRPGAWLFDFGPTSFSGAEPALNVRELNGVLGFGDDGWQFGSFRVVTPQSEFTLDGGVDRRQVPATLNLNIAAPRFAFQEWAGVLHGLSSLAVDSAFDARLSGPPAAMETTIALRSNGGDVRGNLVLDTTVPGWHAKGSAAVQRLDLAHWLDNPERPSDITGTVDLDLDLHLGEHFPGGTFDFRGSHAAYLEYEADEVAARGSITATEVRIARATATAYGANVRLAGSTLAIAEPFRFRFIGTAIGVDLRKVPRTVPVPHVESVLAMDFDVTGQFADSYIRGTATFADSQFLGARLGAGATGLIDTQAVPFHYAGEGDVSGVDLNHFGDRLEIGWLTDPRYAGTVRGRFRVEGSGSDAATMALNGGGRLDEADLFGGRLENATVSIAIANGSLTGTYDGELIRIDPSIPMADALYAARLTGHAGGRLAAPDLLVRDLELADYTISALFTARDSEVRGIDISRGSVDATMADGTVHIERLVTSGPGVDLDARGTLELDGVRSSSLDYRVTRSDLSMLTALVGNDLRGAATTSGRITGPIDRMHFEGDGTLTGLAASGIEAETTTARYSMTVPIDDPTRATGTLHARLLSVTASGQVLQSIEGDVAYDAGRVSATLASVVRDGRDVSMTGEFVVDTTARQVDVDALALSALHTDWRLAPGIRPRVTWSESGIAVAALDLVDALSGRQHLTASGTWQQDGGGLLRLAAQGVSVDSLITTSEGRPAQYGGVLDAIATVTGTREHPSVSADFAIVQGRVRRLAYDRFAGHVNYSGETLQLDVRLDQAPGVWLTGAGTVPLSAFDPSLGEQTMHLALKSSQLSLALVEGFSSLVRNVGGQMQLDVIVSGTSRDPHFSGRVDIDGASFDVVPSGAKYRNGRVALKLSTDQVSVEQFHLEDEGGHPLDVTGSLGTHEMRVGEMQVAVSARGFQVLRNEYGRIDIDTRLDLSGQFEAPRLSGRVTITNGALNVDQILNRTLFQPYATEATTTLSEADPIVALSPWERMVMDIEVHVPGTLRMVGDNVQVSPGTPLGLGRINVRAFGDIYLYKEPTQPMWVNGSFDSLTGTYAFQGRRFDLQPSSSINFRSDLNPELYVTVTRIISGVETRVSIIGPLREPELRLASTPPLDPSDILSLIVFNTSINQLSAIQQQQLAVRAGTLAAGFIAAPMVSALQRTLGLDTLEIEPGADIKGGARVTVGNEIAPGLVARFSRQFGEADYDEATLEYYLSRLFRIRATFSDAGTLTAGSPFRRVERAGVDLLLFFSF